MIGLFPTHCPDELFYSLCAKYGNLFDDSLSQLIIKDLFGPSCGAAIWGLPGHLKHFLNQLPNQNIYSVEQIIRNFTILPYFGGFLSIELYQNICKDLANSTSRLAFYQTGIMASRIPMPTRMRYCPVCHQKDKDKYGESYWHRLHQLPGVKACPDHLAFLENSPFSLRSERKQAIFIPASYCDSGEQISYLDLDNGDHQTLLFLAREAAWLLNNPISGSSLENLRNRYLYLLLTRGYATYTGSIKVKNLLEDFCNSYPVAFLQSLHCEFRGNDTQKANWLLKLVRKPHHASHPLYHLLLLHFLGVTAKEFFALPTESQPFGTPPWPCLNPAAEHYQEFVVTDFLLGKRLRNRKPVGKFYCSCGFCYSRSGPDTTLKDRFHIGKMISFGHVWENELKRLWQNKSLHITHIANQLSVDPLTIKKHAVRLGLVFSGNRSKLLPLRQSDQLSPDKEDSKQEKRNQRRISWLSALNNSPNITMKTLRQKLPQVYQWLLLNDSRWLKGHQPAKPREPFNTSSVNWHKRDQEIALAIGEAVTRIKQNEPRPKRVTKTAIGKALGHTTLLQQKLDKLPLTSQLLTSLVETREDFAIRRVDWVASLYSNERIVPETWQLIQRACIYSLKDNPKIQNAVLNALSRLESHLTT